MSGNNKKTALIVDDDALMRRIIGLCLENGGYAVKNAASIAEAKTHLGRTGFDLILLDIMLGAETGLDLAPLIRQWPEQRSAVVLAVTTEARSQMLPPLQQAGLDGVVYKPINPGILMQTLQGFLSQKP